MGTFIGPESGVPAVLTKLAPGVWVTRGRAAVLEGADHLAVIDPGDEPGGPLTDVRALVGETGKPLRWLLVTHAHPDHVTNLAEFRAAGPALVVAHARSPVAADVRVGEHAELDLGGGLTALSTPGHSHWGDDLSFWHPASRTLFSGDVVQPKGESWESTFYPSPWAFFRDGDVYLESLARLAALPFETLVTGHREIRFGDAARRWVELTARSIERVRDAALSWDGADDLDAAGPVLYERIARERGLSDDAIAARLAPRPGGSSAFRDFDLPGIEHFWRKRR